MPRCACHSLEPEERDALHETIKGIVDSNDLSSVRDKINQGSGKLASGRKVVVLVDRLQTVLVDKVKEVTTNFKQDSTLVLVANGSELTVGGATSTQWGITFNPDTLDQGDNRQVALDQISACEEATAAVAAASFEQARRVVDGRQQLKDSNLSGAITGTEEASPEPESLLKLTAENFTIQTVDFRAMRLAAMAEKLQQDKARCDLRSRRADAMVLKVTMQTGADAASQAAMQVVSDEIAFCDQELANIEEEKQMFEALLDQFRTYAAAVQNEGKEELPEELVAFTKIEAPVANEEEVPSTQPRPALAIRGPLASVTEEASPAETTAVDNDDAMTEKFSPADVAGVNAESLDPFKLEGEASGKNHCGL